MQIYEWIPNANISNVFDGYSGFFMAPLGYGFDKRLELISPCFLDIGPGSFYDFQALEIGGGLTSTNFVLVDGEYAAQTRKKGFDHNPQKIFSWLGEKVLQRFGTMKSATGIIVINAPKSKMELYYNMQNFAGI